MSSQGIVAVLGISVFFGFLASILLVVAVATDYWERTEFLTTELNKTESMLHNASLFDDYNGFYKLTIEEVKDGNLTHTAIYLRANVGGIWRVCDRISDEFKKLEVYQNVLKESDFMYYGCFNYITDYSERKIFMNKNATALVRMQNSAASCNIVSILCVLTAAITGTVGVWQKQVSACMVTGVMYVVAGVFECFSLVIMIYKVNDMQTHKYSLDPLDRSIADARIVTLGWSVPVAWSSFGVCLLAFVFWLLLARLMRLEKAKSIL